MKIGIVLGTRPEIIKMAPVIRECQHRAIHYFIIHSNQHYSKEMDSIFFAELALPRPDYNLAVGSSLHGNQTGNILIKIEPILVAEKPDIVLVQGDTNTVLAGALAAVKLGIKVGHIEAGLRSYDRNMPEETNRVLTDHMSEYLFAVGPNQRDILQKEGIDPGNIHIVGNTVSDALFQHMPLSQEKSKILTALELTADNYFLVTAHRAANVDIKSHLVQLLELLDKLNEKYHQPIVWPIHPRTKAKLAQFSISLPDYLKLIPPVGYIDFIQLQKNAQLILTDSGGIQEEACLLGVPCITLRDNTERPESIDVGANVLVGRDADKALTAADIWLSKANVHWDNPFGDGHVAEYILDVVTNDTKIILAKNQTIAVIGLGYMGLPLASLLAQAGYLVSGVDLDSAKVAAINAAQCPFNEPGLPPLVAKVVEQGFLKASDTLCCCDTYLIAVPTPHKDHLCDLSYVYRAAEAIALVAENGQTVIIESTLSPKTSLAIGEYFERTGLQLDVVHCPERAIPGQTLRELVNNDRVIGASNARAQEKVKVIYQSFVKGDIFLTDLTTAECIKLVENTSRDVGIAFANELSQICQELAVDVYEVTKLANKHPRVNILKSGPGVGGHCIPIDPWFLVQSTQSGALVRLARQINDQRPTIIAQQAIDLLKSINGDKVGILGVTYKADVDDCRETPAKAMLSAFEKADLQIRYHDPYVSTWDCPSSESIEALDDWADILVLVTDHAAYQNHSFKSHLFDTHK
jgi:UDP-N-acetylglucosamine 2-epimerase (non-hydrolysing)